MQAVNKKTSQKGFTLIELMIVIAIIGILAAIAIPQFNAYRVRGFNASALTSAKNAYTASQAFFSDNPGGEIDDIADISTAEYGFVPTASVTTTCAGTLNDLEITAQHTGSERMYTLDEAGTVSHNQE
ncbi:MAG: prepilin-type N-terminal cleavage/methylation domain-containing protein [Syntrophales bacterium]|nr:prepilin-type N-terminal cleavage/methylation domain-containing protein [Syntrophales bacterium]